MPKPSLEAIGYVPPRTYEELRAVLSSGAVQLPKRLQQVAIYFWQHPQEVALGTVSEIAEQADAQPSALVRFAQALGFAGFAELQRLYKDHFKSAWRERGEESGAPRPADDDSLLIVSGLVDASRRSLARLEEAIDPAAFAAVVAELAQADTIFLIGSKRAFPVTAYMAMAFAQQSVRTVLLDNVGSLALDLAAGVTPRDTLLAVSFSPYNSITPEVAKIARQREARVVGLTDSTFSPLVRIADACIEVVEADYAGFKSLAATTSVALAIVLAVSARRNG